MKQVDVWSESSSGVANQVPGKWARLTLRRFIAATRETMDLSGGSKVILRVHDELLKEKEETARLRKELEEVKEVLVKVKQEKLELLEVHVSLLNQNQETKATDAIISHLKE